MVNRDPVKAPGAGENAHRCRGLQDTNWQTVSLRFESVCILHGALKTPKRGHAWPRTQNTGPRRPACTPVVMKTKHAVCCLLKLLHSATSSVVHGLGGIAQGVGGSRREWGVGPREPQER